MRYAAFALAIVLSCSSLAAGSSPVTLRGQILHEDQPLPGVTVRLLELDRVVAEVVSDVDGRYAIVDPPRGYYDLTASLDGMHDVTQEIYVGNDGDTLAEPMSLQIAETGGITFSCGSPCDGEGQPTCEAYERNRELESVAARDERALDELRSRYGATTSRDERARIGAFLVSVLDDDGEYFTPLAASANTLLSLAERAPDGIVMTSPEFIAWCEATGRDREQERWDLNYETGLFLSSTDSRVAHFAHRALRVDDSAMVYMGVAHAGLTCDPALLSAIDGQFDRIEEHVGVSSLAELIPCGDPALNERIFALDDGSAREILPQIIDWRNSELARLGRPQK